MWSKCTNFINDEQGGDTYSGFVNPELVTSQLRMRDLTNDEWTGNFTHGFPERQRMYKESLTTFRKPRISDFKSFEYVTSRMTNEKKKRLLTAFVNAKECTRNVRTLFGNPELVTLQYNNMKSSNTFVT